MLFKTNKCHLLGQMGLLSYCLSYTGSSPCQAFTTTQLDTHCIRGQFAHPITNPSRVCLTPVLEWQLVGATLHWTSSHIAFLLALVFKYLLFDYLFVSIRPYSKEFHTVMETLSASLVWHVLLHQYFICYQAYNLDLYVSDLQITGGR